MIRFGRAALLGVGITAVASVVYVTCWELYLAVTDYAFLDQYVASYIEAKRAAGVSGAELEKLIEYMNTMQENYRNPPFRILMTLLEIFPVGLLVALVSAGILRNPRVLPAGPQ